MTDNKAKSSLSRGYAKRLDTVKFAWDLIKFDVLSHVLFKSQQEKMSV